MTPATLVASPPERLTYEAYLTEEEVNGRYDIIDGERIPIPGSKWWHQRISKKLTVIFDQYERESGSGKVLAAPFDIMIRRYPLRTRQPDVFFISNTALVNAGDYEESGFLEVSPELVVEIISDSETGKRFNAKIADYCAVGVQECWKVLRDAKTVEVLRLTSAGMETARIYGTGERIQSMTFPDLFVDVEAVFAE